MTTEHSGNFNWRTQFSWPIWLRITIGVLLAALIPTMGAFLIFDQTATTVDRNNLEAYVTDANFSQVIDLQESFNRASSEVASFTESDLTAQTLLAILNDQDVNFATTDDLIRYINDQLIGSGVFKEIQLLSIDGIVNFGIRRSSRGIISVSSGRDKSNSPAFLRGEAMVMIRYDQQFLLVRDDDEVAIELVQVIYDFRDRAMGYIVGRLDLERSITPGLIGDSSFIKTTSYLATSDGDIITSPDQYDRARASNEASPVQYQAGERGEIRHFSAGDRDLIGYYAFIPNLPLILVTEIDSDTSFVQPLNDAFSQGAWVFLGVLLMTGGIVTALTYTITPMLQSLQRSIRAFGDGDYESAIPNIQREDEIGDLARTFVQAREQTKSVLAAMEERIANRVRDIQATQEVSRFAVTQRDNQSLMNSVVDLIVELFPNIYHAQIFLVDDDDNYAVLQASTGDIGQQLLGRGHRLQVGDVSVIGQVTEDGRVVVARDTAMSETHRKNEFLPETRAELAIPLRTGDRVIGALDVQSKESDSFDGDQIGVFQTMGDQIAVAIENARLYQDSLRQLEALRVTHQQTTGLAWREYMNFRRQQTLASQSGAPAMGDTRSLRDQAILTEEAVVGEETERTTIPFAVPIQLRGRTLGAVEWELPTDEFSADKLLLAQELVNRLAISLDNARLFQESNRAINRERIVNEIAAHLTGQTDIDEILQTAVREVGRALGAPQVNINLKLSEEQK
jgi:GAF domain-containing protein/HAMP domain-containing protein